MSQYYYNPFGNNSDVDEARKMEFFKQQKIRSEKSELRLISLTMGCAIVAYLIIQSIFSTLLALVGASELYLSDPIFQRAFNVICVSFCSVALPFGIMALINKKKYTSPIIPNKKLGFGKAVAWICFGMLCCVGANMITNIVISIFENVFNLGLTQYESLEPNSVFACIMDLIALAIIPAICEEFAMRCCSLQLLKKYGKGFSVFAVSIVFGIIHGNVIQFVFAFIVGLVLGFVTVKTDNIAPAIMIHAFNNGLSVVNSTVKFAAGETLAENATSALFIFWLIAGIISTIYLALSKEFAPAKNRCDSVLTTGQKFVSFLFPWMIVPFIILILLTIQTIGKL